MQRLQQRLRLDNSLFWAMAFVLYTALRLLVVADFNMSTALTILRAGTGSALIGSVINLVPLLVWGAFNILFHRWKIAKHSGHNLTEPLVYLICAVLATLFLAYWYVALGCIFLFIVELLAEQVQVHFAKRTLREASNKPLDDDVILQQAHVSLLKTLVTSKYIADQRHILAERVRLSSLVDPQERRTIEATIDADSQDAEHFFEETSSVITELESSLASPVSELLSAQQIADEYKLFGILPEPMRHRPSAIHSVVASVVMAVVILMQLVTGPMWLPQENISVKHLPAQYQAVVLRSTRDWTTLLDPSNHQITYVPTPSITARDNCHSQTSLEGRSLFQLLIGQPNQRPLAPCAPRAF